jgi:hypothetical protein
MHEWSLCSLNPAKTTREKGSGGSFANLPGNSGSRRFNPVDKTQAATHFDMLELRAGIEIGAGPLQSLGIAGKRGHVQRFQKAAAEESEFIIHDAHAGGLDSFRFIAGLAGWGANEVYFCQCRGMLMAGAFAPPFSSRHLIVLRQFKRSRYQRAISPCGFFMLE